MANEVFKLYGGAGELGDVKASQVITGPDYFHQIDATGEVQFENTWVEYDSTYGPCGYIKLASGLVVMQGLMKSGTISTTLPAFILPAGYRPSIRILTATMSNSAIARMDIDTNGYVIPYSGNNAWYSIAFSFYAQQ